MKYTIPLCINFVFCLAVGKEILSNEILDLDDFLKFIIPVVNILLAGIIIVALLWTIYDEVKEIYEQ